MPTRHIRKILEEKNVSEHVYRIATFALILFFGVLLFSIIRNSFFGNIDPEKHVYFEIVFLLLVAVLAEIAVVYFKIQSVIVLMILGMLLSSSFIGMAWTSLGNLGLPIAQKAPEIFLHEEVINIFAQLGAVILLFKVGMHSKIEKIFSKENFFVASAGIIVPFIFGYFYAALSNGNFAYSMFVGAAMSATSVGVTVAILKEMKVLEKKFSEVIIGAAVIDDILALLLLSVVINLIEAQGNGLGSVARTFVIALVFILGAIASGKFIISYLDKRELGQKRFLVALAYVLFFSYVAEVIGLSAIIGAFLAGIILNKSRHYMEIEEKTYGLEVLFMPIFFISLGILVDFRAIFAFFVPIIIITLLAFISKIFGCGISAFFSGLSIKDSLKVGIGMVPRGEVALIIASIGLSKGILSTNEYSIISAMALLTSFLVPTLLSYLIRRESRVPSKSLI